MGLKIKNLSGIGAALMRTQDRVDKASLAFIRRGGKIIADQAKLNAPVDTGDLESAIVIKEAIDSARNRRKVIEVGVDPELLDLESRDGFDYSVEMHEGDYKLGAKSREKQNTLGGDARVGPKYLDRAVDEHADLLRQVAADLMRKAIK